MVADYPEELPSSRVNFPFSPAKFPFFYGWVIVIATTIGTIASIPGQTIGVSVFTDFLIDGLHIDRLEISNAYMFGTITSACMLPFAGTILDRIGSRNMALLACLGLGASCFLLSQIDRVGNLLGGSKYVMFGAAYVTFVLIRFFGQGSLTMASRVTIGKWFDKRRGLATGISAVFISFSFNYSPQILNDMIESMGWRGAAIAMGLIVGVCVSLFVWVYYRDNPEECGLVMDGGKGKYRKTSARTHKQFTRREALGTLTFHAFNLALAYQALIITAIVFHIAAIGQEVGISRHDVFKIFLPMSIFGIISTFAGGWLSDRIKLKWLQVTMMAGEFIGIVGIYFLQYRFGEFFFIAGFGLSGGLFGMLATVAFPKFFGRQHLGKISGVSMFSLVFGSAVGPSLFAIIENFKDSFKPAILIAMVPPIILLVFGLFAENPQKAYDKNEI